MFRFTRLTLFRVSFFFFLFIFAVPIASLGQGQGEALTLEQAIALAMRDNPSLKKASLEIEMSADRFAAAATRRLPSFEINLLESQTLTNLDFRFPRGVFGEYAGTGPIPAEDTKITTPRQPTTYLLARASQPITQLHRIGLGLKLEELRSQAAREKLRGEQQSVARDVKRVYYELISLQSAFESVEENIKLYRELDRVVGGYVAEKVALKADGLDVKTQLASEEYAALTLRNSLATQKEQLNALLGRDVLSDFKVAPVTENISFEIDLSSARLRALDQRPEIKAARLSLKQAELDQRIKKSELIPDVSLAVTYLRIAPISVIPQNIASVGVMVRWEPFDWGRKKNERAEKSKNAEQAKLEVYAAETRATLEINALFRKLGEARALLHVGNLAQEAAREKLRVATNRYTAQSALLKDVLQAQSGMVESSHKYQQALLGYWKTRADFARAIGEE